MPATFAVVQAVEFKKTFQQTLEHNPDLKTVVLDFSQTQFIDSSGIGFLISSRKMSQKAGVQLFLQSVSPHVMSILSLAEVSQLFEIRSAAALPERPIQVTPKPASPTPTRNTPSATSPSSPVSTKPRGFVTHPSVKSRTKRLIDVVGALVGLSITGILLVPIAVAIKLDSPGPIFFGQTRCSWMGRRFRMWKFRSMVANAEQKKHLVKNEVSGALFKNANDPRITRVGRFLRKTSLDELPQFWNVLIGEMSLVGTRPPTPDEVERYEIPEWQRLDIKPGMTGEWQVNGRSSVTCFEEVVRLDLKYQQNWSLMYDIQLIFRTIGVIFNKKSGAM